MSELPKQIQIGPGGSGGQGTEAMPVIVGTMGVARIGLLDWRNQGSIEFGLVTEFPPTTTIGTT
jgi:hypothetical protein